ncbi:sulfite reductase subunit alpha [Photobacterium jeanii]|uniref:Sulfite reductase [NADPH] flavoprotein alpha-component n=1 Tax=Photobacterium jeanii TaxID=858640 RepID=A0A178KS08_9GAMM|nr:assimilatory sulfite reductase (NADPH) flavoprotein subunit [Photobacterium jeanii]OAN19312.1 sulfite reductase subunit alpha [Photobacterium jeanii]PST86410.1 assimilatory sulfite reductase (NADPH) flavoprotein subunit [Photobacterium jeanii]
MVLKELSALASPLNDQQIDQLQQATAELSPQQMAWLSGYFWGISQSQAAAQPLTAHQPVAAVASQPAGKLTIIYASQTGNAKGVAEALHAEAENAGMTAELFAAGDYKGKNLAKATHLIVVASTHGEGEAPDDAIELHEFLQSKKAPKLSHLKYAVIGLGDSSYEYFCQTAKDFDSYLAKLGAEAVIERLDCDVDYDAPAATWRAQALEAVKATLVTGEAEVVQLPVQGQAQTAAAAYSKQQPYTASLLTSQKITGRHSGKDVRHIEIDLEGSGLVYEPGDALGVWYHNDPQLAERIVAQVGLTADEPIELEGQSLSLLQALITRYEITNANPQLVSQYAELSGSKKLAKLVDDKEKLRHYAANNQVLDVLAEKKTKLSAEQLIGLLRRLTPRLYSIASSQQEVGEEVHLTVGVVEYSKGDEVRQGGASSFLAHRLEEGDSLEVFVETNKHFKLPDNDDTAVIMVGPGTGIAPFRAFIQERENREASGKNWLFFGDRTFTDDFLYQVEWQKYVKSGVVTRMDVAFSRDQAEKVYVQHKLLEQGNEVWQWLEQGAHFYVCGDANYMAKDVHQALLEIVQQHGNRSAEQAEQYLNALRKSKRYQKDVY